MTEPTTFVIPGELVSSKNSRKSVPVPGRSGKTKWVPVKSDVAKNDETRLLSLFRTNNDFRVQWVQEIASTVTSGGWPVVLRFAIYRQTRRRFDYTNIVQNLLDVMVMAEMLPDDSADYVIPAFDPYRVDKANPRTEIIIEKVGCHEKSVGDNP